MKRYILRFNFISESLSRIHLIKISFPWLVYLIKSDVHNTQPFTAYILPVRSQMLMCLQNFEAPPQ